MASSGRCNGALQDVVTVVENFTTTHGRNSGIHVVGNDVVNVKSGLKINYIKKRKKFNVTLAGLN